VPALDCRGPAMISARPVVLGRAPDLIKPAEGSEQAHQRSHTPVACHAFEPLLRFVTSRTRDSVWISRSTSTSSRARGDEQIGINIVKRAEVIKDEKTGFLVKNVNEAVRALERVSDVDRRACRDRVQQCFSINTMVEAYERVYSTIFDLEARRQR